jgi:hypothetical protein
LAGNCTELALEPHEQISGKTELLRNCARSCSLPLFNGNGGPKWQEATGEMKTGLIVRTIGGERTIGGGA